MAEIVERLRRTKEQIGSVSSVLLDIVNAGDQISRVLKIGYRPALFQDLRDKWVSVSDMESAIRTGIDTIEQKDQIISGLKEELATVRAKTIEECARIAEGQAWAVKSASYGEYGDGFVDALNAASRTTSENIRALSEAASKARATSLDAGKEG